MLVNVKVLVCGYEVTTEIEIEETELEGKTESEKEDYIYNEAYEYVRDSIEVSCQQAEE